MKVRVNSCMSLCAAFSTGWSGPRSGMWTRYWDTGLKYSAMLREMRVCFGNGNSFKSDSCGKDCIIRKGGP